MHPPRRNGATEHPKLADRVADWLLSHCPLSSLTLLTLLVTSPLGVPHPWEFIAGVVAADGVVNLVRLRRQPKSSRRFNPHRHHPTPVHPAATV